MLAIEVEYLLGRCVATDATDRELAEWPPHPSRLFSALVDALGDLTEEHERAAAEDALRWLETQRPPEIAASLDDQVSRRENAAGRSIKHFVPINDEVADSKNVRRTLLVEMRTRQERYFPAVVPEDPTVTFAWPTSEPEAAHARALENLAKRVPYLGHSSSVVRVTCKSDAPARAIGPVLFGDRLLRVPGKGRLDRLVGVYAARKRDTLVQPPKGREVPYAKLGRTFVHGPHGATRVFAWDGPRFGIEDTAWVTQRYRAAFLSFLAKSRGASGEVLSGHTPDGARTFRPHLAFVPLANIGTTHADGSIKGLAVVIPRDADEDTLRQIDATLPLVRELKFGQRGSCRLQPTTVENELDEHPDQDVPFALRFAERYAPRVATMEWVSVTPIALGRHPKPEKGLSEEEVLCRDIADLGLPRPVDLRLQDVSFVRGSPPARQFRRGDVHAIQGRLLRHVWIRFEEPVEGPLIVGAGRYMGFGLLLPKLQKRGMQ